MLGDCIRDKETINSTRSRISSLKGFTFRFIDGRVFFRIFNKFRVFNEYFLQNIRVYKYKSLLESKNIMNMARHSIIAKNKLQAYHKTHFHTMKVYNARPVYSLTIEVFTEAFTCSKVINAFKQ